MAIACELVRRDRESSSSARRSTACATPRFATAANRRCAANGGRHTADLDQLRAEHIDIRPLDVRKITDGMVTDANAEIVPRHGLAARGPTKDASSSRPALSATDDP